MISKDYIEDYITGSSIDMDGVDLLTELLRENKLKAVLELGSGVSTLAFLKSGDRFERLYSVDDSRQYLDQTRDMVPFALRDKCVFVEAPIVKQEFFGEAYEVYSRQAIEREVKDKIDLVFIDGPYARRYGRIATLLVVSELLSDDCIVVLDDADRKTEIAAIRVWQEIFGGQLKLLSSYSYRKGIKVFRLKRSQPQAKARFRLQQWLKSRMR